MKPPLYFSALLLAGVFQMHATEVSITLPPEASFLREGPGLEATNTNCVTCHSAEYVISQPRMPRKFWEETVKKMREKFGAPIADAAVPGIVDYLATAYGAEAK